MSNLGKDIIEGLKEAAAYAKGAAAGTRTHVYKVPDVRAIREKLDLSQSEFAAAYRIPLATLQGWEQGRRNLDRTAAAYLRVITRMPAETRAVLQP